MRLCAGFHAGLLAFRRGDGRNKSVQQWRSGASSGIGYELARECVSNGFDLVIAADRTLSEAALECRSVGAEVQEVQADLATEEGIARLLARLTCSAICARSWG